MAPWLPSGPSIPVGGAVAPPPGWTDLLARRPDLARAFAAQVAREWLAPPKPLSRLQ